MDRVKSNKGERPSSKHFLLLIMILILLAGFLAYKYYEKSLGPVSAGNRESINVEIPAGSSTNKIAEILYEKGLISNKTILKFQVKTGGSAGKLKAGIYDLNKSMDLETIIGELVKGGKSDNIVRFTVPEGYELKQIAERLEKEGIVESAKFLQLAENKGNFENEFSFLKELGEGHTLEGFLFPSTYEVYRDSDEKEIISKMLKKFEEIYNQDIKDKLAELDFDLNAIVTLASIVEREGKLDKERPIMSAVFHNRLKIGMNLQSCATVQYILGERKENLSTADTKIPSPYNTYINSGLPPAPISSPGELSLIAAINPEDVDYLFFRLTGEDGSHTFSRTYEEHQNANPNK